MCEVPSTTSLWVNSAFCPAVFDYINKPGKSEIRVPFLIRASFISQSFFATHDLTSKGIQKDDAMASSFQMPTYHNQTNIYKRLENHSKTRTAK